MALPPIPNNFGREINSNARGGKEMISEVGDRWLLFTGLLWVFRWWDHWSARNGGDYAIGYPTLFPAEVHSPVKGEQSQFVMSWRLMHEDSICEYRRRHPFTTETKQRVSEDASEVTWGYIGYMCFDWFVPVYSWEMDAWVAYGRFESTYLWSCESFVALGRQLWFCVGTGLDDDSRLCSEF